MVIDQFLRFEQDVLTVVYERPLHDGCYASPRRHVRSDGCSRTSTVTAR